MTDTDFRLILEKLDRFEQKLKELEAEIKALKPKYEPWQSDDPNAPYYRPVKESWPTDFTKWGTFPKRAVLERPCIFDSLPPEDRMKPMGISCGCPKCSPYCLGGGSLQSTSTGVWMNPRTVMQQPEFLPDVLVIEERKDES